MLTQYEVTQLARKFIHNEYVVDDHFNDLYEYFLNNGEMPYGVAKSRTGDPYTWIGDKLYEIACQTAEA